MLLCFTRRVLARVFFFSSRRRHTRYWRDWSSVCSSDLADQRRGPLPRREGGHLTAQPDAERDEEGERHGLEDGHPHEAQHLPPRPLQDGGRPALLPRRQSDRKSVVQGKSVDLGGRRIIK